MHPQAAHRRWVSLGLVRFLAAATAAAWPAGALGQFNVTELYDAPDFNLGDGSVDADPAAPGEQRTLRACIQNVNIQPPGSYTILVPTGAYLLSQAGAREDAGVTGDLDIHNSVSIIGAGVAAVTIDSSALGDRIFDIHGASTVYLNDLTLTGRAPTGVPVEGGGAIRQAAGGLLQIGLVHFTNCTALGGTDAHGGAVLAEGSFLAAGWAVFENNSAAGHGGAVYCAADAHFAIALFRNNASSREGGAVRTANTSPLAEFLDCTFDSNTAQGAGGAINHRGPAEIHDCRFVGNDAVAVGGAVNVFNRLLMTRTFFEQNDSASGGGALNITGGVGAEIRDCFFFLNSANTSGGAITNAAPTEVWNTTFAENFAFGAAALELGGGAIYSFRPLYLINSTLSRNHAPNGLGGAILNLTGGAAELVNVTIAGNDALQGHSVCNGTPGGGATMRLDHTILSADAALPGTSVSGTSLPLLSLGHNFDSDGSSGISDPSDVRGAPGAPIDPLLAPLALTGGFAPTHELRPGSLCWDTGDVLSVDPFGNGIFEDQRGSGRPIGPVERGAVEMTSPAPPPCGDTDGDLDIDISDLGCVLTGFGQPSPPACGDVNHDGFVDITDLGIVLLQFGGLCP